MKRLFPEIQNFVNTLDYSSIDNDRKKMLNELAGYIQEEIYGKGRVVLTFICTHNSRRSQLCQVWARVASLYYEIENIRAWSGGTEVTAFHPNAINALEACGFTISPNGYQGENNPIYSVAFSREEEPLTCYSKKYTKIIESREKFAAIMTCDQAESHCPFIPGAPLRILLNYEDPKKFDGTDQEKQAYAARNRQIANEMFYVFSKIIKQYSLFN